MIRTDLFKKKIKSQISSLSTTYLFSKAQMSSMQTKFEPCAPSLRL